MAERAATSRDAFGGVPRWLLGLGPLALIAAAVAAFALLGGPGLGERTGPPVEKLAVERTVLEPGVIELTGSVGTPAELRRAVEVTQGVSGVTTVVNRLEVGMEASRMSERRRRYEEGDPALREQHWYGVGVGTGRRRQGASTDPDRRDDRVDMLTEAFEEQAAEVERAEDPDAEPQPGGGAPPVL